MIEKIGDIEVVAGQDGSFLPAPDRRVPRHDDVPPSKTPEGRAEMEEFRKLLEDVVIPPAPGAGPSGLGADVQAASATGTWGNDRRLPEPPSPVDQPHGVSVGRIPGVAEVLWQLFRNGPTWDGDVVSKAARDALIAAGHAQRLSGWTSLTERGVRLAIDEGMHRRKERQRTDEVACKARASNTTHHDPADCDWPVCGCDDAANKVVAALEEQGAIVGSRWECRNAKQAEAEGKEGYVCRWPTCGCDPKATVVVQALIERGDLTSPDDRRIAESYRPRSYLPTLAELIDRYTIVQLKAIFIPQHAQAYREEIELILEDVDNIMVQNGCSASFGWSDFVQAVAMIMLSNRYIWENEARAREGGPESDRLLKLTHSINGVRNRAKNVIAELVQERRDHKTDSFAAELVAEFGNWDVFSE